VTSASIVVLVCLALGWAALGRVEEVAVAHGSVVPRGRAKAIQPVELAVVRSVPVADGQRVHAGEVLLALDPTDAEADAARLGGELAVARAEQARLAALLHALGEPEEGALPARGGSDLELLRSEVASYRASLRAAGAEVLRARAQVEAASAVVARLEATLPLLASRADALRKLAEEKLVAGLAYLEVEEERVGRAQEILVQRRRLAEAEAALRAGEARRDALEAEHRAGLLSRQREADRRAHGIEQELRKATHRGRLRDLTSPVDGWVQQLAVRAPGAVVSPGQTVMVVVPDGDGLEVRARLPNRDAGFVHEGQAAAVKVEAFPFTRYGTVRGTVAWVSRDAVPDERMGSAYEVRVALDAPAPGVPRPALLPGMAVTAEVMTGERRVIDFFLSPLRRYRDESLRER
jgi:hemolysin D